MEIKQLIESQQAVMVFFTGNSCSACSALKPKIAELIKTEYPKIGYVETDVTLHPDVAAHFTVFTVPAAILFTHGKEANRFVRNFGLVEVSSVLDRIYPLIFD
jgi:thioredoxin-like negative regulator of GroEL